MKTLVTGILIALALSCNAQFNIDLSNAKPSSEKHRGEWLCIDDNKYMFTEDLSPVGVMKIMERARQMIADNKLKFSEPDFNNSLLYSTVKDLYDYQGIYTTATIDFTTIDMGWKQDNWYFFVKISKDVCMLMLLKF